MCGISCVLVVEVILGNRMGSTTREERYLWSDSRGRENRIEGEVLVGVNLWECDCDATASTDHCYDCLQVMNSSDSIRIPFIFAEKEQTKHHLHAITSKRFFIQ